MVGREGVVRLLLIRMMITSTTTSSTSNTSKVDDATPSGGGLSINSVVVVSPTDGRVDALRDDLIVEALPNRTGNVHGEDAREEEKRVNKLK